MLFSCTVRMDFVAFSLRLIWRHISDSLVGSVVIVEINVFCNRNSEFCFGFVKMLTKILLFDGGKKGLDHRIIVGLSGCRKRLGDPISYQRFPKVESCILGALVAVKNQFFRT